ncbi:MAG TPA: Pls/PosA family non-ribosomal peptide synthetase [Myxococcota bacterium]|nr:Pls/PosA family non-ribosomal peptide synthetase [Myxococcota bacterium]
MQAHLPLDRSATAAAREALLHEIFEVQADRRGTRVAVAVGDEHTSYDTLERRANRLARYLRRRGVRRGSLAALLLPRGADAYAALLGVLKAGAAYVPLDPEYPDERVRDVLADCRAAALVTTAGRARPHASFGGAVVCVDADAAAIGAESPRRLSRGETGAAPGDLCYVIYTSGSTGRPKGVMIEHRSASHLVRCEGDLFGVRPEDRVYQGFSLSFDASVEEVWLAFQAGATLVPATPDLARAGPDLGRQLSARGVTVLSCVPTLLVMSETDAPTVRLIVFGGEVCPPELVERWARPGRRVVNTYGPTETTVIATYADVRPGGRVPLGRPVPGYRVHVLDDALRPVRRGEAGEICVGGIGVARGYVGHAEENAARFVPDPFAPRDQPRARLYRTGDLGRVDSDGNLEFLGRRDSQVKVRGFRVELAEIESALLEVGGVRAAACAVRADAPGEEQLVGYVVPRAGAAIDQERLRVALRRRLPAFMVPALFQKMQELPHLPSGKLDRAALPAPTPPKAPKPRDAHTGSGRPAALGRTPTERRIAEVWEALFRPQPVALDDDFFLDLGGHSLLAARMVSALRRDPRFAGVAMLDVYEHPTIASLAATVDAATGPAQKSARPRRDALPAPLAAEANAARDAAARRRHVVGGLLQTGGLYLVFAFRALQWITPYLVFFILLAAGHTGGVAAAWALAATVAAIPMLILAAIAAKWIVLGRVRAGRYPLWGAYYLRFWLVRSLIAAVPLERLSGTPLLPWFYRLLGARIGRNVHLETDRLVAFDLITVGDGTSVDESASLLGCAVEQGALVLGPVQVGRRCFVGARAVLREDTAMGDGARLEDLSLLPRGARVPAGETWAGSPARRSSAVGPAAAAPAPARTPARRAVTAALYATAVVLVQVVPLAAFVPGIALLMQLDPLADPWLYLAAAPAVGASFVVLLTCGVVVAKWLLVGRVRAGTYPLDGSLYVRKWIVDQLLAVSLDAVGSLHATLYLPPWYRALGARLGRLVELSTAASATPDLLEIGDGGTVADEASLGAGRVEGGWLTLGPARLGRRAFLGNGAVLPAGTALADGALVGVLSLSPPAGPAGAARPGGCWLGSPPVLLPRRQPSAAFCEQRTYDPPRWLRLARAAFEILRVTLPPAGFIVLTTTVVTATVALREHAGLGVALLALPAVYAACCAALALAVAALKWAVLGRFRSFEVPLWTPFVWRLEMVNALYEFMVSPLALEALQGTPLLPWYYRLLGARIGRRTYFHTTGLIEFDLVEVGDEAVVGEDCVLQSHLFEDRVLKAAPVRVGKRCEIGAGSVVLYDTVMEDGARLDALSLLMKGETLPAGTAWAGVPAARAGRWS